VIDHCREKHEPTCREPWSCETHRNESIQTDPLLSAWQNQVFEYNGKRYRTNRQKIEAAVKAVCDAEKFDFKNHNYLKKILLADAEMLSAEGLTAREEAQRDVKRKRSRLHDHTEEEPQAVDMETMRKITEKNFRKIRR